MSGDLQRSAWDVVIVGAGSAGAALAARLSEDADRTVLLLEAGRDHRAAETPAEGDQTNPLLLLDQTRFPELQWIGLQARYTSAQQGTHYPRGRGVGGSSAINGRVALRPPLDEFDAWARLGGERWGPDQVLASFNALEDDLMFGHAPYHGNSGPVPISRQTEDKCSTVHLAFRDAALEEGEPWCDDVNAPTGSGVGWFTYNGRDGARHDVNTAYLEPARDRPNLDVLGGVLVDRVLVRDGGAVGVAAVVDGRTRTFHAGEVVLSAGAIHSPAILLRSGIGPADDVRALGIDPIADLPVGRGLQDHPSAAVAVPLAEGYLPPESSVFLPILRASSGEPGCLGVDLQIQGIAPESIESLELFPYAVLAGTLNQPIATGTVRLASPDPSAHPEIDLNLLSHATDAARMRLAVRRAIDVATSPAFRKITTGPPVPFTLRWDGTPSLGASIDELATDVGLDRWLMETVSTSQHASCTCPLGSVVGPDARVLGLEGLRVADMSISPTVPRANTNLTAIMIGEHVASIMRGGVAAQAPETAGSASP